MKTIFFVLLYSVGNIFSQTLWVDRNLYSVGQDIKVGSAIQVFIKDGFRGEYTFEGGKDDSFVIRSHPDKKFISENPSFNADRSIASKQNAKSRSVGKILGSMSVLISEIDPVNGMLTLLGTRELGFDSGKTSLKLTGKISTSDLKEDKTVSSERIANLKIEYNAAPTKEELKDPDIKLKKRKNANGTAEIQKAELSEDEKQIIILKNLKRLLGESQ
jgi:flagellar L-ring protein FlgH